MSKLLEIFSGIAALILMMFMTIGIPVLIVAMGISLHNNWSTKDEEPLQQQIQSVAPATTISPAEQARQDFMGGCDDGTNTAYCACTWREVNKIATIDELESDAWVLTEQELQQKYAGPIEYCYNLATQGATQWNT